MKKKKYTQHQVELTRYNSHLSAYVSSRRLVGFARKLVWFIERKVDEDNSELRDILYNLAFYSNELYIYFHNRKEKGD